eukprot:TRINITY_DN71274_c0_g1_i1.p1 TRINITY_DN71274_c0_g1~~TRINITY_DN71274_c0_g1_i1.p1  ORF type:complete len:807 (+),score=174.25 TRINITY_DN71274_c0_g1_i1:41-2422(+)
MRIRLSSFRLPVKSVARRLPVSTLAQPAPCRSSGTTLRFSSLFRPSLCRLSSSGTQHGTSSQSRTGAEQGTVGQQPSPSDTTRPIYTFQKGGLTLYLCQCPAFSSFEYYHNLVSWLSERVQDERLDYVFLHGLRRTLQEREAEIDHLHHVGNDPTSAARLKATKEHIIETKGFDLMQEEQAKTWDRLGFDVYQVKQLGLAFSEFALQGLCVSSWPARVIPADINRSDLESLPPELRYRQIWVTRATQIMSVALTWLGEPPLSELNPLDHTESTREVMSRHVRGSARESTQNVPLDRMFMTLDQQERIRGDAKLRAAPHSDGASEMAALGRESRSASYFNASGGDFAQLSSSGHNSSHTSLFPTSTSAAPLLTPGDVDPDVVAAVRAGEGAEAGSADEHSAAAGGADGAAGKRKAPEDIRLEDVDPDVLRNLKVGLGYVRAGRRRAIEKDSQEKQKAGEADSVTAGGDAETKPEGSPAGATLESTEGSPAGTTDEAEGAGEKLEVDPVSDEEVLKLLQDAAAEESVPKQKVEPMGRSIALVYPLALLELMWPIVLKAGFRCVTQEEIPENLPRVLATIADSAYTATVNAESGDPTAGDVRPMVRLYEQWSKGLIVADEKNPLNVTTACIPTPDCFFDEADDGTKLWRPATLTEADESALDEYLRHGAHDDLEEQARHEHRAGVKGAVGHMAAAARFAKSEFGRKEDLEHFLANAPEADIEQWRRVTPMYEQVAGAKGDRASFKGRRSSHGAGSADMLADDLDDGDVVLDGMEVPDEEGVARPAVGALRQTAPPN